MELAIIYERHDGTKVEIVHTLTKGRSRVDTEDYVTGVHEVVSVQGFRPMTLTETTFTAIKSWFPDAPLHHVFGMYRKAD